MVTPKQSSPPPPLANTWLL